jgi:hypothetical protein
LALLYAYPRSQHIGRSIFFYWLEHIYHLAEFASMEQHLGQLQS